MTILFISLWIFSFLRFIYVLLSNSSANNSKMSRIIERICDSSSLIGVLILVTSNVTGEDIINYSNRFNYDVNDDAVRERFFFFMRITAYQLGADFFTFRSILQAVAGIFLYSLFRHYNINFSGFLVFYMPILLFMDSMQFRNSISIWLLAWASFFISDKIKWGTAYFIIVILMLVQIHTAFIFYAILLAYLLFKKNPHFYTIGYLFVFLFSLVVLFNGNKIPFLDFIFSHVLNADDARNGIYTTTARLGFVYPTFVQIILIMILNWGNHFKLKELAVVKGDGHKLAGFYSFVMFVNKISLLFIPFMMTNITYYRFLRNGYFLAIISIVGILGWISKPSQKATMVISLALITLMWMVFEIVIYDTPELIISPILQEGELFYKAE